MTKTNGSFIFPLLFLLIVFSSCSSYQVKKIRVPEDYVIPTRDNPHLLKVESKKGELIYYGAVHSIDANNPQNAEIEELWESFQPTLAFSEGGIWPFWKLPCRMFLATVFFNSNTIVLFE